VSDVAVSGVAFVSACDSPKYKALEEEIQSRHSCAKVEPVSSSNGHTPTLDDYWCGVSKLLKKGHHLVYIVWSGALENLSVAQHPPVKELVSSLIDRPLQIKDSRGSTSVMHRLIFLQLGSKGTVDYLLSSLNSLTVFYEISVDDNSFDPKQCAEVVCKRANDMLKEHSDMEKLRHQKHKGGLQMVKKDESKQFPLLGKESVDGLHRVESKLDKIGFQLSNFQDLSTRQHEEKKELLVDTRQVVGFIAKEKMDEDLGGLDAND
jgi:hypothetical protein